MHTSKLCLQCTQASFVYSEHKHALKRRYSAHKEALSTLNTSKLFKEIQYTQENFICSEDKHIKITLNLLNKISNNVVCSTNKGSDQAVHTRSLIRAFASRLNVL